MNIRPFTDADYAALTEINNVTWEDEQIAAEAYAEEDEYRDPKCKFDRWVAEVDGRVVGMSQSTDQLA